MCQSSHRPKTTVNGASVIVSSSWQFKIKYACRLLDFGNQRLRPSCYLQLKQTSGLISHLKHVDDYFGAV